ncbi:transposase [Streptomyces sp. NBC_01142]|nr:transposase [Streptomyces sp. NBC_01142]
MRHRVRAGCPWRDVPERYGPWSSLYRVFRRYQREGETRPSAESGNVCPVDDHA